MKKCSHKNICNIVVFVTFSFFSLFFNPLTLRADINGLDVTAMVKALDYVRALDRNNNNQIEINIIYSGGDGESIRDAEYVRSQLIRIGSAKAGKINAKLIAASNIASEPSADVYFLSSNMSDNYNIVSSATQSSKILTLSNDLDCVESELCGISVNTQSATPVYINESVLNSFGYDIDSNFRYLAKRI